MKFFALPCLIVAAAAATSSVAREAGDDIQVSAPSTVAVWSQTVTRELDREIGDKINSYSMHGTTPTGVATVRFLASETGEPTAMELVRKSPNSRLNSLARSAVSDLTLNPLPVGIEKGQVYIANIVVASDDAEYARHMATLRDDAQKRAKMAGRRSQPIAFNVVRTAG